MITSPPVLSVLYRSIDKLQPYARNARTHTKEQIRKVAESIRQFGFTNPILIDKRDVIIAGHARLLAAKSLGMVEVPTIQLEKLTPAQVSAYVLADNRLAEDARWDKDILRIEIQEILLENKVSIDFTGFEVPEIDLLVGLLWTTRTMNYPQRSKKL